MVATAVTGNLFSREFKPLIVDEKVGIEDIARDMERGRMEGFNIKSMVLLNSRADVVKGTDVIVGLERLKQAMKKRGIDITVVGLIPVAADPERLLTKFVQVTRELEKHFSGDEHLNISTANLCLFDQQNVFHGLVDNNGLTLDGKREFMLRLTCI